MISLTVNDQSLDLGTDFSITFNFKSPIFNETGSYSYPIKIPYSIRNAGILNFKNRVESFRDFYEEFPCKIIVDNQYIQGLLKCKIANNKSYEGSIYGIDGDFYYQIKDLMLNQVDMGSMSFDTDDLAIQYINDILVNPNKTVCFPEIFNDVYLDPVGSCPARLSFNKYLNNHTGIHHTAEDLNPSIIVPMLYFNYVHSKVFESLSFELKDQLFSKRSDFDNLILFNSTPTNNLLDQYPYDLRNWYFSLHVPRILIKDFLKGIETAFNARYFINGKDKSCKLIAIDDIIKNPSGIDFSKNIISISLDVDEQIRGLSLKMNLDGDDEKQKAFSDEEASYLDTLKGAVPTVADLLPFPYSDLGEYRYVIEDWQLYKQYFSGWLVENSISEKLFSQYYYKFEDEKVELAFSSLLDVNGTTTGPVVCGNKKVSWREITPRIFFQNTDWVGGVLKCFGKSKTANISLFFNEHQNEKTLFHVFYKSYSDFRTSTKKVTISKFMTFKEIIDLDFSQKYRINGVNYLLSEVQVTLKNNSISPAVIKAYTCY